MYLLKPQENLFHLWFENEFILSFAIFFLLKTFYGLKVLANHLQP